jgi:hypothetical protein
MTDGRKAHLGGCGGISAYAPGLTLTAFRPAKGVNYCKGLGEIRHLMAEAAETARIRS